MKLKGGVSHIYNPEYRCFGNLWRLWFKNQWFTPKGTRFGELTFSPNWKDFPHPVNGVAKGDLDTHLTRMKNRGIAVMACFDGSYNEHFGTAAKSVPKDTPTLDKTKLESYSVFRKIIKQGVLRYGSVQNDALIDIAPIGSTGNPQEKKSGLNVLGFVQLLNEVNKYNGKPDAAESLTGKEYAPLFDAWCNDIWSIDPAIKIISAPTARFDSAWLNEFYDNSTAIKDARTFISINIYLFGPCGYSSTVKCNVVKPEDAPLFKQVNDWLFVKGKFGFITEHGCCSEKLFDLGYPDYPGLDKFQAQAKFIIDSTNRWLSMSNIEGATFYQLVDDPNEPRFSETGVLDKDSTTDPTPKPSYAIVKADFDNPTQPPIPPNPTSMKAYYSNNPQRTGQIEITPNFNFPVQAFTIEIKDVTGGIEKQLRKNGVTVILRTPESQPPLDVPGTEANGTAKMINPGAGNYELTVWKGGVPTVFNFTVGSVTPPPVTLIDVTKSQYDPVANQMVFTLSNSSVKKVSVV